MAALAQFGSIPAFPHVKDSHSSSPTTWQQNIIDMIPLLGAEWRSLDGTSTPAAEGSPYSRLCAGIVTIVDSEKFSAAIRGWIEHGLPDPDDGHLMAYENASLAQILQSVVKIALKDKEASASTVLAKAAKGLRD